MTMMKKDLYRFWVWAQGRCRILHVRSFYTSHCYRKCCLKRQYLLGFLLESPYYPIIEGIQRSHVDAYKHSYRTSPLLNCNSGITSLYFKQICSPQMVSDARMQDYSILTLIMKCFETILLSEASLHS